MRRCATRSPWARTKPSCSATWPSRGSDTLATSYTLALVIRKIGDYDLILCGKQAIDGDTGQVGPGLAERLGLPQVTFAIGLEVARREAPRPPRAG